MLWLLGLAEQRGPKPRDVDCACSSLVVGHQLTIPMPPPSLLLLPALGHGRAGVLSLLVVFVRENGANLYLIPMKNYAADFTARSSSSSSSPFQTWY